MSIKRHSYPDSLSTATACAEHIAALLRNALITQPNATLAVSGGSTPQLMFQHLAGLQLDWNRVHLFWVDERAVPPTDSQSNYRMAEQALIRPAHVPAANVHRIPAELPPAQAVELYIQEITQSFGLGNGELPHFDIIQCGLGADSHTASLFPGEPLISDRAGIAAAVQAGKEGQWRITLLPAVLQAAKNIVFLVTGADKETAVRNVFEEAYDPIRFPAQVVARHGANVTWFLDEAAARGLK